MKFRLRVSQPRWVRRLDPATWWVTISDERALVDVFGWPPSDKPRKISATHRIWQSWADNVTGASLLCVKRKPLTVNERAMVRIE